MALARSGTGSASRRAPAARTAGSPGRRAVGAGLLELQAAAGNAAVAQLVQRTQVQGDSAKTPGHDGDPAVGAGLLGLQAAAGNAAVARLVQRTQVQRADAGWEDAKKQGHYWNAAKRTVGS